MPSLDFIKKTPLAEVHEEMGARMVEFSGWLMPVQYEGIIKEHHTVRQNAGLFDISHMGNFIITGEQSADFLDSMLTNHVGRLDINSGQYTLMLNEKGGVIDDLLLYRIAKETFYLVVNAAKIDEDLTWLQSHTGSYKVEIMDASKETTGLALQGPRSEEIVRRIFSREDLPFRNKITFWKWLGKEIAVARTGYTGEDGFEFFLPAESGLKLWKRFLERCEDLGCQPCGLGARDTLRLEACLPLNGSDLSPSITPIEADLKMFVKLDKGHQFTGSSILKKQVENGPPRRLMAFSVSEKSAPPRSHYPVYIKKVDEPVGEVTSGGVSPILQKGIGLALIEAQYAKVGTEIEIEIRGKRVLAKLENKPLYKKS